MTEQTEIIEDNFDSSAESTDVEYTESEAPAEDDGHEYVEVSNADEYWDAFDLNAYITESSDEDSEESDDAEASDEAAFPSDDESADADHADTDTVDDSYDEEFVEEDLLNLDLDRPAPLSRRKAERVVKGIIEPLRDPNTPIADVLTALTEFHPTRTQQLAEAVVQESVQAYPNEWLKHITGLEVTVDQIKEWAASGGRQPSNPAPAVSESSEIQTAVEELTSYYGEDWKNPELDDQLLESDIPMVQSIRAQLAKDEAYAALQRQLEQTEAQLNELKPQIDSIKTAQEAEYEQLVQSTFAKAVDEYRTKVETNAIPKVLDAKGLAPKESDPDEIKAVKQMVASRFQPIEGYGSEFDIFLEKQFSGRESMTKAMNRVANYLAESAKLEAQSRRTAAVHEAQTLKTKAQSLKEQAVMEQDALTVWTRKAAAEFLETSSVQPILQLIQQNADLQRRLQGTGRPEIIGQTAAIGEGGFKSTVQQAKEQGVNPFDIDISGILGGR